MNLAYALFNWLRFQLKLFWLFCSPWISGLDKATSNVCTAQVLLANMAGMSLGGRSEAFFLSVKAF